MAQWGFFLRETLNVLTYCGNADVSPLSPVEEIANNWFIIGQFHHADRREKMFLVLFSIVTSILFFCAYAEPWRSAVPLYFFLSIFHIEFNILISWTLNKWKFNFYQKTPKPKNPKEVN